MTRVALLCGQQLADDEQRADLPLPVVVICKCVVGLSVTAGVADGGFNQST